MLIETNETVATPTPPIPRVFLGRDRTPRLVLRPRVLLAEDDTDLRNLVRWALKRDGCDVIESRTGRELLDYIETSQTWRDVFPPPDLILADSRLSDMDGLDVLWRLRKFDRRTPLILLVERVTDEIRADAVRLGALAVYQRTVDLTVLRAAVRAAVAC